MKQPTQKSLWASVFMAIVCGVFSIACNDDKPAPSAPPSPAPVFDRIAQRAPTKQGNDPIYGFEEWPRIPQALAEGEGRELTEAICSACHSTAYIIGQPPLEKATWKAEVTKMIEAYGATVPEGDGDKIVAYLTAHYGPQRKAASASASAGVAGGAAKNFPRGASVYESNCVACHQLTGGGVPRAFPPLAGHVPELLVTDKGRTYLPQVVLYGLQGPITVKGTAYDNVMTPFKRLSDDDLAEVLNHICTAWGNAEALKNFVPFTAKDIAAQRNAEGSAKKAHDARP